MDNQKMIAQIAIEANIKPENIIILQVFKGSHVRFQEKNYGRISTAVFTKTGRIKKHSMRPD